MSDYGWTWGDLAGELMARGIDPDSVSDAELWSVIDRHTPERAADDLYYGEGWRRNDE